MVVGYSTVSPWMISALWISSGLLELAYIPHHARPVHRLRVKAQWTVVNFDSKNQKPHFSFPTTDRRGRAGWQEVEHPIKVSPPARYSTISLQMSIDWFHPLKVFLVCKIEERGKKLAQISRKERWRRPEGTRCRECWISGHPSPGRPPPALSAQRGTKRCGTLTGCESAKFSAKFGTAWRGWARRRRPRRAAAWRWRKPPPNMRSGISPLCSGYKHSLRVLSRPRWSGDPTRPAHSWVSTCSPPPIRKRTNQSINQSINQSNNYSWVNQSINQSNNYSWVNQSINQSTEFGITYGQTQKPNLHFI